MTAYYNEHDPQAAAWIRELIKQGHVAPGDVDERSIEDVLPSELLKYTQCHFFAGIAVWSYALRRAGWPDDRRVWTGSCPCQPFSAAGKGEGFADERHLWPAWFHLIEQLRPDTIFGEQVSSKDILPWFDLVCDDLEATGYTIRPLDFPAASVGCPGIRQRLYFVADAGCGRVRGRRLELGGQTGGSQSERYQRERIWADAGNGGEPLILADTRQGKRRRRASEQRPSGENSSERGQETINDQRRCGSGVLGDPESNFRRCELETGREERRGAGPTGTSATVNVGDAPLGGFTECGDASQSGSGGHFDGSVIVGDGVALGDTVEQGLQGYSGNGDDGDEPGRVRTFPPRPVTETGPTYGFWRDAEWIYCRDEKYRPIEPSTFPLVTGAPARVGRLRGYGNSINAEAAIAFIESYLSLLTD